MITGNDVFADLLDGGSIAVSAS